MKHWILGILFFCSVGTIAQQDGLFSQYMFNPFAVNPAYAGSRDAVSGVMLYRNQWSGFQGSPELATIAVHSPIQGKNFALGLNMFAEEIGPTANTGFSGTYAYHMKLGPGKLSLGMRAGIYHSVFNKSMLVYDDPNDVNNTGGAVTGALFNADFGAYYYTTQFYGGFSVNHLPTTNQSNNQTEIVLEEHMMLATGYAFIVDENFIIKPSTMIKATKSAPMNIDLNISALFNKVFWLGLSFRTSGSVVMITEYNISDFLRIGYSYDFDLGVMKKYNSGSHELFVGCDFNLKLNKSKSISPRYL